MPDAAWYGNAVAVLSATISGVALGVSGFSIWYARRQTLATERQADEATNSRKLSETALSSQAEALKAQSADTSKALEIAQRNADAAERLAETNEALAISGQRGWFIVAGYDSNMNSGDEVSVHATITFRNVGRTPIGRVTIRRCERIAQKHPESYEGLTHIDAANIPPDGVYTVHHQIQCKHQQWSDVKKGKAKIFFFGNLSYEDVFGYHRETYWDYEHNGHELNPCEYKNKFT